MIENTIISIIGMYMETIKLASGLIILMSVNIILGAVNSLFESEFDIARFFKGIGKAVILVLCFGAVFFAGVINKDTLSVDMGTNVPAVDIIDAMHALLLAGYFVYSKQVLKKMNDIVGVGWTEPNKATAPQIAEAPTSLLVHSELTPANEEEGDYV